MLFAKRALAFIAASMLAGCAASGPLFKDAPPPATGKALVYIYRPSNFMLGARDAYFYVDGKNVADLSSRGYTQIYLEPGKHLIKQKWPIDLIGFRSLELPLTVEANETYYYRFYSDGGPCGLRLCFQWSFRRMTKENAESEIALSRYQPPK